MKDSPLLLPGVILVTGIMVSVALLASGRMSRMPQGRFEGNRMYQQQPMQRGTMEAGMGMMRDSVAPPSPVATGTQAMPTAMTAQTSCTESGGTYRNTRCSCPTDYTLSNAQCIDAMGVPGGRAGMQVKADHTTTMKISGCAYSGGTMAGTTCRCPADYSLEDGVCVDAFGLPGGQQGRDQQAQHPMNR